jgi:hypothetical protein
MPSPDTFLFLQIFQTLFRLDAIRNWIRGLSLLQQQEPLASLEVSNVPGQERQQHAMDLYFKLASSGGLSKCKHTAIWLAMFVVRADGCGLLHQGQSAMPSRPSR